MNIIWNIQTVLEASGSSKVIKIDRMDRWDGIKLSEPNMNVLRGVFTTDITNSGEIFKNIPINWYMVEH